MLTSEPSSVGRPYRHQARLPPATLTETTRWGTSTLSTTLVTMLATSTRWLSLSLMASNAWIRPVELQRSIVSIVRLPLWISVGKSSPGTPLVINGFGPRSVGLIVQWHIGDPRTRVAHQRRWVHFWVFSFRWGNADLAPRTPYGANTASMGLCGTDVREWLLQWICGNCQARMALE